MSTLSSLVAVVTGASRGIGRGIAHELGVAGATVYVTGRTRDGDRANEDLPGTIDETARLVSSSGGQGIPVRCDHTREEDVARLAEAVREGHGHLDLLVNNVWGGYEDYDEKLFYLPPWEQPVWRWDKMLATGVRAHYLAARALSPLMLERPRPLIVGVSAGDDGKFLSDVQYDVAKAAVDRLHFALAARLRSYGIAALTIHSGFARTERVEKHAPPEALKDTHTPRFVGRLVAALAADPEVARRSGEVIKAAVLGAEYGVTDVDGRRPEPFVLPENA